MGVLVRRLQDAAAGASHQFSQVSFAGNQTGASELTQLWVGEYPTGGWKAALQEAERIRRQAVEQGIEQAEVDREVANTRQELQTAFQQGTSAAQIVNDLVWSLNATEVYTSAEDKRALGLSALRGLKAATVTAALREVFQGSGPMAFVSSPAPVSGGQQAVLTALQEAEAAVVEAKEGQSNVEVWPYTNFGKPGVVSSKTRIEDLDLTTLSFENGARLNIKPNQRFNGQVRVEVQVGNGRLDSQQTGLPSFGPTR